MKGYELIPIAAGGTLALVALLALLNGTTIRDQGRDCDVGNATQCERQVVIGDSTLRVVPYLLGSSILLVGLGVTLVLFRRWYRPSQPIEDEGPPYP